MAALREKLAATEKERAALEVTRKQLQDQLRTCQKAIKQTKALATADESALGSELKRLQGDLLSATDKNILLVSEADALRKQAAKEEERRLQKTREAAEAAARKAEVEAELADAVAGNDDEAIRRCMIGTRLEHHIGRLTHG